MHAHGDGSDCIFFFFLSFVEAPKAGSKLGIMTDERDFWAVANLPG